MLVNSLPKSSFVVATPVKDDIAFNCILSTWSPNIGIIPKSTRDSPPFMINDTWGMGLANLLLPNQDSVQVLGTSNHLSIASSGRTVFLSSSHTLTQHLLAFLASQHPWTMRLVGALKSIIIITSGSPESIDYQNQSHARIIPGRQITITNKIWHKC